MRGLVAVAAAIGLVASAAPAAAQAIGEFPEVLLIPAAGSFEVDGRVYSGELRVRAMSDGLSLVEFVDIDGYLAGIREVPAEWPEAALEAQAVAARTYLAWTLSRGRSGSAADYGFDICATTQCQVYAGTAAGEPRWVEAVDHTRGEVLLYEGEPAQALYSSTSGGQTEPIQDIFAGSSARPYLAGADSPDETSPYVTWSVAMPARAFVDVLAAAGVGVGELIAVDVTHPPRGEGVWTMEVVSSEGVVRLPVSKVRSDFNRHGPELFPDLLPALRPDGRRYPQTILSYRFEVEYRPATPLDGRLSAIPVDDRPVGGWVEFAGRGWGHHVGMSQYGALAMAEKGEDYAAILSHYYGGLLPQAVPGVLPPVVAVGLDWGRDNIVVKASGPFSIVASGRTVEVAAGGTWILKATASGAVGVVSGDLILDRLLRRYGGRFPLL
jgi:stage II sporulation protein D